MPPRLIEIVLTLQTITVFSLGCASAPAVHSSTPDGVAVEFPRDDTVSSASVVADKECKRHGKLADFDSVDMTASPKARVAKFHCVSGSDSKDASDPAE